MIRQVDLAEVFTGAEFVPQAVINRTLEYFEHELGIRFGEDADDLDTYKVAGLKVDGRVPLALIQYRGHPADEVTLYMAHDPERFSEAADFLPAILEELHLPRASVTWIREPSAAI
ncbi:hypothetical protein JMJ56_22345 [Belnapia sp. T18]|uniref:Uncharacterized protein n=1 Tax=Belnapia arida TaxID=2804533 RepID=A0ABS1U8B9_9PROT|nr:hypothetical protein [Belnapia arida]MBL6080760.1 hypothetical protein [Belnapia arida]